MTKAGVFVTRAAKMRSDFLIRQISAFSRFLEHHEIREKALISKRQKTIDDTFLQVNIIHKLSRPIWQCSCAISRRRISTLVQFFTGPVDFVIAEFDCIPSYAHLYSQEQLFI